jgi:hypothetical protein
MVFQPELAFSITTYLRNGELSTLDHTSGTAYHFIQDAGAHAQLRARDFKAL